MHTILTCCTSKKNVAPQPSLCLRDVAQGTLEDVAMEWGRRINAAAPETPAVELYAGRDYRRLVIAAGEVKPFILSAGLGLLAPDTPIPSYDATVAAGVEDSVFARVRGKFSPRDWFDRLQMRSRYAARLRDLPRDGLILAALPARYLAMIAEDLVRLGPERIRLFTGSEKGVPSALLPSRMPYDGLLSDVPGYDGPLVGFAERALSHFLTIPEANQSDVPAHVHHRLVREALRAAADERSRAG